ncbi:MAG: hypothetical protein LKE40_06420 [Spirochaetia bacterium]|nr:hypothetical protein [Spirochaetia bacterium]
MNTKKTIIAITLTALIAGASIFASGRTGISRSAGIDGAVTSGYARQSGEQPLDGSGFHYATRDSGENYSGNQNGRHLMDGSGPAEGRESYGSRHSGSGRSDGERNGEGRNAGSGSHRQVGSEGTASHRFMNANGSCSECENLIGK